MRQMIGIGAVVLLSFGLVLPSLSQAASGRTVYVDDTGTPNPSAKGACGKPNYASIQAAVDDLSASKVIVCEGVYTETVTVERSLSLEGKSGATIQAPAGEFVAIVLFRGPQESRIKGFTISGAGAVTWAGIRTNGFVCEDSPCGPTVVSISKNHISDIYASSNIGEDGTGIFVYQSTANLEDNYVERYGYSGITLDGSDRADTSAQVDDNTIVGQGANGTQAKQVGVRIDETNVDMEDNTISGNYGSGPDGEGIGILVEFTTSSIRDNIVTNNDIGVAYWPGSGILRSNEIHHNAGNGIELRSAYGATIVENESSNNGGHGIFVQNGTTLNTLRDNKAFNNGASDIVDENGNTTANSYSGNKCGSSNPIGICK